MHRVYPVARRADTQSSAPSSPSTRSRTRSSWAKPANTGSRCSRSTSSFRYLGPPDHPAAVDGMNHWVATFASATTRAAMDAGSFEDRIDALKADWRNRLGRVRARSATSELLHRLPGMPIVTVNGVAEMIGRSVTAANEAIDRFVRAGILTQATVGRRNRAWEATEAIDAFTDFERALASPTGDTRSAEPARTVPARRQRY